MIALRGRSGRVGTCADRATPERTAAFIGTLWVWIGKSVLAGFPIDGVTMTVSGGWLGETLRIMVKTRIVRNKF